MNKIEEFAEEVKRNIASLRSDADLQAMSRIWVREITRHHYSYNFSWLGRPIIQLPQDIVAIQELIWNVKPDLIIETGIAHGGSLILSASILELIGGSGRVLGVDIEIRDHNRAEIEKHPMAKRIDMIQGSSIDQNVANQVADKAKGKKRVLVFLDSNHTHNHVLTELKLYAPFVTKGSYCVVFDSIIEDMPQGAFPERSWDKGNNPKTAVWEYLKTTDRFEIDKDFEAKLLITVAPDGFLKCIRG
jgi:cephalosporin hydroxylase